MEGVKRGGGGWGVGGGVLLKEGGYLWQSTHALRIYVGGICTFSGLLRTN